MSESRRGLIVPLMKAKVPVEVQLEFPLPPGEDPIREPFAGDLYVTYAFEPSEDVITGRQAPGGRFHEHVARRHCAEMGVPPEQLRRQAAANLRTLRPDLSLNWYPDVRAVAVAFGCDLEAGLLLDDGFVEKLSQDVEGDLVVAVPARDVFVATGTGYPDGIEKLRWAVDRVWAEGRRSEVEPDPVTGARSRLLTRQLLVRRGHAWGVLAA